MAKQPDEFEEAWARIVEDLTSDSGTGARESSTLDEPGTESTAPPASGPDPARADSTGTGLAGTDEQAGLAALFEPLRRARGRSERERPPADTADAAGADDPGAFVDNWEDEGHYVPPPPPEIPEGTPLKRLAWAGLLGGPAAMILLVLTGWDVPRIITIGAGLATLAGFVTLVWQLPDAREDGGWDDGARL
jgi:hypothetical protein